MIDQKHIDALSAITGPKGAITNGDELKPYITEWRDKFIGQTPLMVCPATTEEAASVVRYCNEHKIAIVPQGGNTGLVGGGIPGLDGADEILLSTRRMRTNITVDASAYTLVADAGVTVEELQRAATEQERLFALSLASEGSCTAGGVASTNAGGMHVIRYGTARDMILGIEAVLPNGEIVADLSGLKKDNTGYPVSRMLVGAEGTLGLITKVCFRLFPKERAHATAWLAVPHPRAALELLALARDVCEDQVSVFELMHNEALDFVYQHIPGARDPLPGQHPWTALIETASSAAEGDVDGRMATLLERALALGVVTDGALAQSLEQRASFWKLREAISEAQKLEGGSIKHDISVPLGSIAAFIEEATEALLSAYPGCRVTPFGHLGDGNLHFNVMQPTGGDKNAFLDCWEAMNRMVHDFVLKHGGSISAEHGIGVLKKEELARVKPKTSLDLMRAVKKSLDPKNIMNPRCLFD